MKRFHFQLAPVLGYKQQVLEGLMTELGALQERLRLQEARKNAADRRLAAYGAEYEEKKRLGITPVEAMEYQSCQEVLAREARREAQELEKARRRMEAKRQEVVAARQDTVSLEKLRDLRRKEYDAAVLKEEEKALDDLTASRRAAASL